MKLAVLLIVLLAGCAAIDPEAARQAEVEKQEQRAERIARQGFEVGEQLDRIDFPSFIDSWGYIDDQTIWLESRPRRYYLVTTSFSCPDLAFSRSIGLKSRTGLYLMELDDIITERQSVGHCQIDSIYQMSRQRKKKEPIK